MATKRKTKTVRSKSGRTYTKRTPKTDSQAGKPQKTTKPEKEEVVEKVVEETIEVKTKQIKQPQDQPKEQAQTPRSQATGPVAGSSKNPIVIYKSAREVDSHLVRLFGNDYFISGEQTTKINGKTIKGYIIKTKDQSCQCYFDMTAVTFNLG
jgi:hypothetical protein